MTIWKYFASLALSVCALCIFTGAASAQDIHFYNRDGVEVSKSKPFPLDRLERGERYRVTINAPNRWIRVVLTAANGFRQEWCEFGRFEWRSTVPRDPSFDNAYYRVIDERTKCLLNERRLPIGSK